MLYIYVQTLMGVICCTVVNVPMNQKVDEKIFFLIFQQELYFIGKFISGVINDKYCSLATLFCALAI